MVYFKILKMSSITKVIDCWGWGSSCFNLKSVRGVSCFFTGWMGRSDPLAPSWCLAGVEWNDKHGPSGGAASPTCQSFCVQSFSRWFPGSSVSGPCHMSHYSRPRNDYRNIQGTFRAWSQHRGRKRHTLGKFLEVKYICWHRVHCWVLGVSLLWKTVHCTYMNYCYHDRHYYLVDCYIKVYISYSSPQI